MTKILVAYFSASGVTRRAAREIADAVQGDLVEIEPVDLYTDADLDWSDKHSRSTLEMQDATSRPAMKHVVKNMEDYDTVFVGFPIWWGVEPRIVDTFFDSCDFHGKTMIAFGTPGGSGMTKADESVKQHCPSGNWKKGAIVNRNAGKWAKAQL